MELLWAEVEGAYAGSGISVPVAAATLKQAETYSCNHDTAYLVSWADSECCDDPDFADWESAWQALMNAEEQCSATAADQMQRWWDNADGTAADGTAADQLQWWGRADATAE